MSLSSMMQATTLSLRETSLQLNDAVSEGTFSGISFAYSIVMVDADLASSSSLSLSSSSLPIVSSPESSPAGALLFFFAFFAAAFFAAAAFSVGTALRLPSTAAAFLGLWLWLGRG